MDIKDSWINQDLNEIKNKIDIMKDKLKDKINSLPDNPKINRVSANCFILNYKDLDMNNWTPQYYDFKRQYKFISDMIDNSDIKVIIKNIDIIITKGKLYYGKIPYNKEIIYFNPEVVNYLKTIR